MRHGESDLFKKYRVVNRMTSEHALMLQQVDDTVHVVSMTENGYLIYDASRLNLLFCGPMLCRVDCGYQYNGIVYVCSGNKVYVTVRGEVIRSVVLHEGSGKSNKRVKVAEEGSNRVVKQIIGFGSMLLLLKENELVVTDDLNEMYKIEHEGIVKLFHPHTYVNKVIKVLKGGQMVLFNVMSRKVIYTYKAFESMISVIEQSSVIDVAGIGLEDGTIHIFNLKSDKMLFSLKMNGRVNELSFGGNSLVAVSDAEMAVFDLDDRRKMMSVKGLTAGGKRNYDADEDADVRGYSRVISARFLDNKSMVLSTENAISIYEIKNYTLELIKRRSVYNGEIVGMEFVSRNSVLLFGPRSVFSTNIYKDEQSFMFKFKGAVEIMDVNHNAVCFGNKQLHALEFNEKRSRLVLRKDIKCLAVYKDFCCFGKDKVFLINLRSKLVHARFCVGEDLVDIAMDLEQIVVATVSGLYFYSMNGEMRSKYECAGIRSIKLVENFVVIRMQNRIVLYEDGISRVFAMNEEVIDYGISSDSRWIAILCGNKVTVYDIVTSIRLDMLEMDVNARFVRFSPDMDFLLVASENNDLILFSNKMLFLQCNRSEEDVVDFTMFKASSDKREEVWKRERCNLCSDLLLIRGLHQPSNVVNDESAASVVQVLERLMDEEWIKGLCKQDVLKIMSLMMPHMSTAVDITQRILFSILKYKSHLLEPGDISAFGKAFGSVWADFEESMLKTIGYLTVEAEGLI
ncbi:hypothetical protein HK407_06g11230 [Ordospora pajunii]|uniref:uncharacterized protein n=1 Tax=Ordospora pajunii TaxID=3039483 RepID=UPI00295277C4|nr:uncharacterized protein HK407_06g11230 [Ordospora pajunii]KAH9411292.1 hypothetical protein HK407_06g11230 [Ordospora pajunii]